MTDLDEIIATLLACDTAPALREAWLGLSDSERAALRWSPVLGRHAERVLRFERETREEYAREIGEHLPVAVRRERALGLADGVTIWKVAEASLDEPLGPEWSTTTIRMRRVP